jgi:predicted nuclease of predicted toxin-antitoxin system
MLRLLADENFNGDILRGLLLIQPDVDIIRAQDVQLAGEDDRGILAWAARNDRIVLTHDRSTMPDFAYERLDRGEEMVGIFVLNGRFPVKQAIQQLLLMVQCSEHSEWNGRVIYLPF